MPWGKHVISIGEGLQEPADPEAADWRKEVEPWLAALLQGEHLALLVGSGLPIALADLGSTDKANLSPVGFDGDLAENVDAWAKRSATELGRGDANIEDQIRAAIHLIVGLDIQRDERADAWRTSLSRVLKELVASVLSMERGLAGTLASDDETGHKLAQHLISFLLTFASRTGPRERLQLFTTNYDRVLEYGCDLAGIRTIDRFVGALSPVFRTSRLDVDMHYNPPGIRGEPRYLEGVIRLTKLHGSLDWRARPGEIRRIALPIGADIAELGLDEDAFGSVIIYPNPAKDVETLEYPYAELFRDFSAALCRPNSVLVTYGYGFGDDHINRVIADMLTIPSTHLLAIAYEDTGNRLARFVERSGRDAQVSLLVGPCFGDLTTLVHGLLPKPAIDVISLRKADLMRRRAVAPGLKTLDGPAREPEAEAK